MSDRSDLDLVRSFQEGDERSFNELVLRYREKVYWVARRFTNDHDEADEITQETFVKSYTALKDFRGDSSPFTWLYRVAVNTALNFRRKQKVREFLHLDELFGEEIAAEESPHDDVSEEEQRNLIKEAVERLPEKQKAVFVLRFYEELSYEEMSKILKTSVGGLKANYFHAVRKVTAYVQRSNATR